MEDAPISSLVRVPTSDCWEWEPLTHTETQVRASPYVDGGPLTSTLDQPGFSNGRIGTGVPDSLSESRLGAHLRLLGVGPADTHRDSGQGFPLRGRGPLTSTLDQPGFSNVRVPTSDCWEWDPLTHTETQVRASPYVDGGPSTSFWAEHASPMDESGQVSPTPHPISFGHPPLCVLPYNYWVSPQDLVSCQGRPAPGTL